MGKGWDKTQDVGLRARDGADVLESWMEGSGLGFSLGLDLRHSPRSPEMAPGRVSLETGSCGPRTGLGLLRGTHTWLKRGQHGPCRLWSGRMQALLWGSAWQRVGCEEVDGGF